MVEVTAAQLHLRTRDGDQYVLLDDSTSVSPHSVSLATLGPGTPITVLAEPTTAGGMHALQVRVAVGSATQAASGPTASGAMVPATTTSSPLQESADLTIASAASPQPLDSAAPGIPWAWGIGRYGSLGSGTTSDANTPFAVAGLNNIVSIASGGQTLALTTDGTVLAWGSNREGELGTPVDTTCSDPWGTTIRCSLAPVHVPGLTDVVQIATGGGAHSIALRKDGTVWVWGYNPNSGTADGIGELGVPAVETCGLPTYPEWCTPQPTQVPGLSAITAIAAGEGTYYALRSDGTVMAWGTDFDNQLGMSGPDTCGWNVPCARHPVQIPGLTDVKSIWSGADHALAVRSDGSVVGWGWDGDGELGMSPTAMCDTYDPCIPAPAVVPGLSNVDSASGGYYHSLVLLHDGSVLAFGDNEDGELALDPTTTFDKACNWWDCSFSPVKVTGLPPAKLVSAGYFYSAAVDQAGVVWNWGYNWHSAMLGIGNAAVSSCYGEDCSWAPVRPLVPSGMNAVFTSSGSADSFALRVPASADATDGAPDPIAATFDSQKLGLTMADPVNSFSGSLTLQQIDLQVPARGLPLSFSRTYNSRDTRGGVLGKGWSSDLDWRIQDRNNRQVAVTHGDGRRDVFTQQPNGSYQAPVGVFDTLTKTSSGWSLQTHEQVRYAFIASGALMQVTDRAGNRLMIQRDANDRVTQLTDATGRALTFGYTADGNRLSTASDPSGRSVTYQYTSDGHLGSVTDPSGAAVHYAYGSDGYLSGITDPNGTVTLTNVYDSQRRVITQSDGTGATTHFTYDDGARTTTIVDPLGRASSVLHDIAGHVLSVKDADGKSVSYMYDSAGNRTDYTDRNGNHWRFSCDAFGNRTGVTDPAGGHAQFTYDTQNNLLSRTDPLGQTWRYTYDAHGVLSSVTDPTGAITHVSSDSFGEPAQVTDADGVTMSFTYDNDGEMLSSGSAAGTTQTAYDAAGRVVKVTDANGHATNVTYDADGRPTSLADPVGNTTKLTYDAAGNLIAVADPTGAISHFEYDAHGRVIHAIDPLGHVTKVGYDADGNRMTLTDAGGATIHFAYDALDRLVQVTDALNGTTTLEYDPNGNLLSATDARGANATFTYDFRNLRTSSSDRTGAKTTFSYDATGRLVATSDPTGATTQYGYDAVDRLVGSVDALGDRTQRTFTPAGRLGSSTDANGNKTTFGYDPAGRQTSVVDAAGDKLSLAYDPAGNIVSRTDPLGHTTRYQYDAANRLQQVVDALDGTSQVSYDALGRVVGAIDANGHATHYAYDARSRLTAVTDALGGLTRYAYDPHGNLTGVTDANNHTRSYAYDVLGRLTASTDALGHAQQFGHDANGNRTSLLDANGKTTAYAYDAEDRLTSISYADGTRVQYTYDAVGRRTSMADGLGTTSYIYDAVGQLTGVSDPFGKLVQYAYDPAGNRTAFAYPDGSVVRYAYDALNRLSQITDTQNQVDRYGYDAAGHPIGLQLANGTHWQATYDALNRLLSKTTLDARGQVQSAFAYTYDPKGNVLSEADGTRHNEQVAYGYDALDRLIGSTRGGLQTHYQYDAVGNWLDVSTLQGEHHDDGDRDPDTVGLQAQYDAANQLTSFVGPDGRALITYTYDGNGNLLSRNGFGQSATYSWDAANRLSKVNAGELTTTYRYDGDGNLYQQQTSPSFGAFDHDRPGLGNPVTYTFDQSGPLSQVLSATDARESANYVYGLDRLAATSGGDTIYYGTDVRGSVRTITDVRGEVLATRNYDPFGVPLGGRLGGDDDESMSAHAGKSGNLLRQFGFTGALQDPSTGLVNIRARFYQPSAGRFLNRDTFPGSLTNPLSQHAYLYAGANPTTFVDPSGHFTQPLGSPQSGIALYSNPRVQTLDSTDVSSPWTIGPDACVDIINQPGSICGVVPSTSSKAKAALAAFGVAIANKLASGPPQPGLFTSFEAELDNNAIVEAIDNANPTAVETALAGRLPVVSPQALTEYLDVPGRSATAVQAFVSRLGGRFGVLDDSSLAQWIVNESRVLNFLYQTKTIKLEDAKIFVSALLEDVNVIVTRDDDFQRFVNMIGPFIPGHPISAQGF